METKAQPGAGLRVLGGGSGRLSTCGCGVRVRAAQRMFVDRVDSGLGGS
jgi:hypothetical protein